MSYPAQSNFRVRAPGSAWWLVTELDGRQAVFSSQGSTVVRAAQTALGLDVDGVLGPATMRGLLTKALDLGSYAPADLYGPLVVALRRDLAARSVSRVALEFMVWVAFGEFFGGGWSVVKVPLDAVLPLWGFAPAMDDGNLSQPTRQTYYPGSELRQSKESVGGMAEKLPDNRPFGSVANPWMYVAGAAAVLGVAWLVGK